MSWRGHFWTVYPHLRDRVLAAAPPQREEWSLFGGEYPQTGALHRHPTSRGLVVLLHGLGGTADSGYMLRMAREAWTRGFSCLRLNMRGADGQVAAFYHAGLTRDLAAALRHPAVRDLEPIYLIGFSLGGHVVLRFLSEDHGGVVRGASICPPLDLAEACRYIDSPRRVVYRQHLLRGLKRMYRRAQLLDSGRLPDVELAAIQRIRDWDELVVAPHHGFASADDYYRQQSVAPVLDRIRTPTLVLSSEWDPMIHESAVTPHLGQAAAAVRSIRVRAGGHVGFPRSLDAGIPGPLGLEAQVIAWLAESQPSGG